MPTQDDIANQQQLLAAHRATLAVYLIQRAQLGPGFAPPGVTNGIHVTCVEIRRCKAILAGWGEAVEDHPDDDGPPAMLDRAPTPAPAPTTTASSTARVTLLLEGDVQQFTPEQ